MYNTIKNSNNQCQSAAQIYFTHWAQFKTINYKILVKYTKNTIETVPNTITIEVRQVKYKCKLKMN